MYGWLCPMLLGLMLLTGAVAVPLARADTPNPSAAASAMQSEVEKARLAINAGRLSEAVALAKEAIAAAGADKSAAEGYEVLASALYMQKDARGAVAALNQALRINPAYSPALASLGGIAFNMGRLPEARHYLEQAIKISPDLMAAHERLGLVLQQLGDIPGALHEYELSLLKTPPDYVGAKFQLAQIYLASHRAADAVRLLEPLVKPGNANKSELVELGNAYLGVGDGKKAVPLFSAALLLDRNDTGVALALGAAQRMAGLDSAAADRLQQVVKALPDSALAHYELGMAYMALTRYPDAEASLVRAIQLEPKAIQYRLALGHTLMLEQKPQEALTIYQEITAAPDAGVPVYDGIAAADKALHRPAEAEATYREAIKRYPKQPLLYARLGETLAEQGKYPDALQALHDGIAMAPDDPLLLGNLALTQAHLGQYADALAAARHLVQVAPANMEARFLLGTMLDANGKKAEAIPVYRAVLAERPDNPQVLNNLASCLTDTGDAKAALPLARRAMTLAKNDADVTDTLGWALLKSGQAAEAVSTLKTATELRKGDATLLYHLAVAQNDNGEKPAARSTLTHALALPGTFRDAAAARTLLGELSK